MKNKAKILIQVKDVGFTFLLDKRMKHNLISPTFLAFFKTDKQKDSLMNNGKGELNVKPKYNTSLPFFPAYDDSISLEDTFHYVGKKVVWCSDNKFRECKAVKLNFEYEGHPYSELFFVDKSVEEDYAILGSTFWSKCDILK